MNLENIKNDMPTNKNFGFVFSAFFLIIFLYLFIVKNTLLIILLFFSLLFLILGALNSKILSPLNSLWMRLGKFLGYIIAPFIMFIIYILLVCPIGFLLRLFNKDILNIKTNHSLHSYWEERKYDHDMKDQF